MESRFKEFIYRDQQISDEPKINKILSDNGLDWFIDCEFENAEVEIKNKTIIWKNGLFYNGSIYYIIWKTGKFLGGIFENGIWEGGQILSGDFKTGLKIENT